MRLIVSTCSASDGKQRHTLRSSNDDGSTLGDVGNSSSGQEEGTVLVISFAQDKDGLDIRCWSSWSCQTARW